MLFTNYISISPWESTFFRLVSFIFTAFIEFISIDIKHRKVTVRLSWHGEISTADNNGCITLLFLQEEFSSPETSPQEVPHSDHPIIAQPAPSSSPSDPITVQPTEKTSLNASGQPMGYGVDGAGPTS